MQVRYMTGLDVVLQCIDREKFSRNKSIVPINLTDNAKYLINNNIL